MKAPVSGWRAWARGLKQQTLIVWFAARDPRTPWWVRALALAVAAYALSPIDLIPDFIPVLGYLDDLLLVPLGLALVLRMIPDEVRSDATARASELAQRPTSGAMAAAKRSSGTCPMARAGSGRSRMRRRRTGSSPAPAIRLRSARHG